VNGDSRVNDDATARRRQLGRALRQARTGAGLTQIAVAGLLKCGQAKINKIERTLVAISMRELDRLIEIYAIPPERAAGLRKLAELDQKSGPQRRHPSSMFAYTELSDLEPDAAEITCWHSERLPGPLQSEAYILAQGGITHRDEVVELLSQRRVRAQIFSVPNPPRYRAILSESSLRRMPGGQSSGLMVDQAGHLLELMTRYAHLELRILTFEANIGFVDSDFQILRFNSSDLIDFAYIEYPGGSRKFARADELRNFQEHWDLLSKAALNRADTMNFLRGLA
jgi:transcriptional regulator with XRE-family HTH domain